MPGDDLYGEWSREDLIREIERLRGRNGLVWQDDGERSSGPGGSPFLLEDEGKRVGHEGAGPCHMLIEGDNIHALNALARTMEESIGVIYIDPPYNTGNGREWKYRDRYSERGDLYRHGKWLSFMECRLRAARILLSGSGILFISIDDNEHARLRLLCDSIFGEENFIATFIRRKKSTSTNVRNAQVSPQADYILCYGKSRLARLKPRLYPRSMRKYPFSDKDGRYRTAGIEKRNSGSYRRDTMHFPILGMLPRAGMRWQMGEKKARGLEQRGRFTIERGRVKLKIYEFEDRDTHSAQPGILEGYGSTQSARHDLDNILGEKGLFDNPKPVELIKHLISMAEHGNRTVVMDFFAGSGTTGQAVLEMNAEDSGSRRFILVTSNEDNTGNGVKVADDICYRRLRNVILGYSGPRGEVEGTGGCMHFHRAGTGHGTCNR